MSHICQSQEFHLPVTSHQKDLFYRRALPQFNLNTQLKLPPIVRDNFKLGRGGTFPESTLSKPSLSAEYNVLFPRIVEKPSRTRNGSSTQTARSKRSPAKPEEVSYIEDAPFRFPKYYTVLPPIGQTFRPVYNGFSNAQESNGSKEEQFPSKARSQAKARQQRAATSQSESFQKIRPVKRNGSNKSTARGREEKVEAVAADESIRAPFDSRNPRKKLDEENNNDLLPNSSDKETLDTEVVACETIFLREKLELSMEAKAFLASEHSKRRRAVCSELDSSLKGAVDIIRDILLRQTMEELCMMW